MAQVERRGDLVPVAALILLVIARAAQDLAGGVEAPVPAVAGEAARRSLEGGVVRLRGGLIADRDYCRGGDQGGHCQDDCEDDGLNRMGSHSVVLRRVVGREE